MKNFLFLLIFLVIGCSKVFSQSLIIDSNATMQFLYNCPEDVSYITNNSYLLSQVKIRNGYSDIKIIKNRNGLFCLINGTGRLYKAISQTKKNVVFERIDSTEFYGNTFNSIDISYNNIIYSYGGYGNFRENGQLRYFNQEHEWSIIPINEEIEEIKIMPNYLENKSKLYFIGSPTLIASTNKKTNKYNAILLDLGSQKNIILGEINKKINISHAKYICDFKYLNGALIDIDDEIFVFDYENNKVLKFLNNHKKNIILSIIDKDHNIFFSIKNKIYFNNRIVNALQSLSISINEFKVEPYKLYEQEEKYNFLIYSLILILVILFFTRKRFINKKTSFSDKEIEVTEVDSNNEFNNIEKSVINLIIENSEKKSFITVDQLNEVLGLKKKSLEIQKRVRSETINRINYKFNILYNQKSTFIERIKSKDDGRFYNYMINFKNIIIYKKNPLPGSLPGFHQKRVKRGEI